MKGVVLAAGKGTRMLPLTERRPKPLVPVVDRPMVEHIITGAHDAGVDEVALIIGHLGEQIIACLGDGSRLGMRIEYIWQGEPRGTGHAALLAEEFVAGERFFMSWGDIIVPPRNYAKVVAAADDAGTDAVLSLNWVEDPCEGAAVYVADGFVERIEEKPPRGTATTHFNNAGLFVYGADIFDRLRRIQPSSRGEIELPDAVQEMVREGRRIRGVELEGYWSDVARPATVLSLNALILQDRYGGQGGVYIDPQAVVAPTAVLEPPVYVGPGCEVMGARLGPNVALMADCHIQEGAHLAEAAVFTGARVGGGSRARYCLIEEGAWVGEERELLGERDTPLVIGPDGSAEAAPQS